jgi:ribosomal protein S18 acetylase RimI-like enzyme
MGVSKSHQGKGHGSLLLEAAAPKITKLRVDPNNENAIGFYKKFGFKVLRESNWITGKRLVMQRT